MTGAKGHRGEQGLRGEQGMNGPPGMSGPPGPNVSSDFSFHFHNTKYLDVDWVLHGITFNEVTNTYNIFLARQILFHRTRLSHDIICGRNTFDFYSNNLNDSAAVACAIPECKHK